MPVMPAKSQPIPTERETLQPENSALLTEFLANNDAPCPVCGYNLRNLVHGVCPECGQRLTLQVGVPRLRFGPFLLFLAPMVIMSGFAALATGFSILEGWPSFRRAWGPWTIMLCGWTEVVAVVLVYSRRHSFLVLTAGKQIFLAGLSWCVNILVLTVSLKFGAWD